MKVTRSSEVEKLMRIWFKKSHISRGENKSSDPPWVMGWERLSFTILVGRVCSHSQSWSAHFDMSCKPFSSLETEIFHKNLSLRKSLNLGPLERKINAQ